MGVGILKRGIVSGLVGAMTLVVWFFAVDWLRGDPLGTVRFVATALLGGEALAAVPAYTILHFMSFLVVGFASAWAIDQLKVVAPTLIGLAIGFLLFDMIFYGSVWFTGADIVGEFGWRNVLAGNLLGGLTISHTIHLMEAPGRRGWLARALRGPILREGALVGTAGALAVAVWFLVLDYSIGTPLRTPSSLGGLLFGGETEAARLPTNMAWVWGYTVVHLGIGLVLGPILAAAVGAIEKRPPLLIATILAFISFEALVMGVIGAVSVFVPHSWVAVAGGNLFAAATMVAILWMRHPQLGEAVARLDAEFAGA